MDSSSPFVHLRIFLLGCALAAVLPSRPLAAAPLPGPPQAPLSLDYRCDAPATLFWVASALSGDAQTEAAAWRSWWQRHPAADPAAHARESAAIEQFGRLRATYRGRFLQAQSRANPWVPVVPPSSHRLDVRFAAVFLGARDADQLRQRAQVLLAEPDQQILEEIAGVWLPKLASASAAEGPLCRFARAFDGYAQQQQLKAFLQQSAGLLGANAAGALTVQFVPAPTPEVRGPAEAASVLRGRRLGNFLVVEVRADDAPQSRGDVVVHEAVHWLQERAGMDDDPQLIAQVFAGGDLRAAQAWELLAEGSATALGQGLWLERADPRQHARSLAVPLSWYVDAPIDAMAKNLAPVLRLALERGQRLVDVAPQLLQAAPPPPSRLADGLHRYVLVSDHRDSAWLASSWFAAVPPRAVWRADLAQAPQWQREAKAATIVAIATWGELKGGSLAALGVAPPPAALRKTGATFVGSRHAGARLLVVAAPSTQDLQKLLPGLAKGDWPAQGWRATAPR
jgi:hypothetical protein